MGLRFREHWFGFLLAFIVLIFLVFVSLVALAPHNDSKMRGFTPCTYQMGQDLSEYASQRELWGVMTSVTRGYVCYVLVIGDGVRQWAQGAQKTPWENYLFEVETYEIAPEDSEPFSEELIKANLLDDEDESLWQYKNDIKE